MNKENKIWVKIDSKSYYNVLIKLNDIGISLYDNKKEKDFLLIKTTLNDYKKIKKYLISYKINIYDNTGLYKLKEFINKYIVFIVASIISILLLFLVNNLIFKVEVKTNNENIQKLLTRELKKYGLSILKLKVSHNKIEEIVTKILDNNKDVLEWLEIKYDGLVMIVNVTEKTIEDKIVKSGYCNIIASSDAKISSMNIYRGVPIKEINDYVLKGDIILSGSIIHNEEVKNMVCAGGEIYGEVWYKIRVEVPLQEEYIDYTGKNRYNLNIKIDDNIYKIFKSRIKEKKEEETSLYKLNDFEINLVKEKEFVTKTKRLTEEAAYNKAISLALEKVNLKLDEEEEILLKKVLKKEVNDSTIYLEIFIVTKENIGVLQQIKEDGSSGIKSST